MQHSGDDSLCLTFKVNAIHDYKLPSTSQTHTQTHIQCHIMKRHTHLNRKWYLSATKQHHAQFPLTYIPAGVHTLTCNIGWLTTRQRNSVNNRHHQSTIKNMKQVTGLDVLTTIIPEMTE